MKFLFLSTPYLEDPRTTFFRQCCIGSDCFSGAPLYLPCSIPNDLELKAILSKYHAWVHYFVGTPNNPQDLARVNLRDARAAIVLATPSSSRSEEEDGANIMQAITLKAQRERLRVMVQLHHFRNKVGSADSSRPY
ncbi:unnamed protein product [Protopolystoma xenopodis]|uniref:RCK N-terminal domain-containing protein n=1 Tax=Protopolystoma xenopodis TaxID=117903 RepID=A0A3S5BLZ0_9PLAT|nr:unnamed protein product [Protopolystoma xenopodis]